MNRRNTRKLIPAILIFISGLAICFLFGTPFAENTIDYISFFVGIFLVFEAGYKILKYPDKFFPVQMCRFIRMILGTCVFSIHLFQFVDKF
jgi:hypothetical protein